MNTRVIVRRSNILGSLNNTVTSDSVVSNTIRFFQKSCYADAKLKVSTKVSTTLGRNLNENSQDATSVPDTVCLLSKPKINFEDIHNRISEGYRGKNYNFRNTHKEEPSESESSRSTRLKGHFYGYLYPWKSKEELAEYLSQNVIHQSDGILAVNKPFGVGVRNIVQKKENKLEMKLCEGKEVHKSTNEYDNLYHIRGVGACEYTLEDLIPILRKRFELPHLELAKSTDKFSSGVAVFSANKAASSKIQQSIKMNKHIGLKTYAFYVISTNISKLLNTTKNMTERVAICMAENERTHVAHPIITREFSKRAVKEGDVIPVNIDIKLLDQNYSLNVCCSQIYTSSTKHNFLRIYYASIVSPILGDHLYSSRVRSVGGVMALIPPAFVQIGCGHQLLSTNVVSALGLQTPEDSIIVPVHTHLHSLTLGNFFGKEKHLQLIAPLTPLFFWTCEKLSLRLS